MIRDTPIVLQVAIRAPLFKTYSYQAPRRYAGCFFPGQKVRVPFGRRDTTGFVTAIQATPADPGIPLKAIADVETIHDLYVSQPDVMALLSFLRSYYFSPPGYAYATVFHDADRPLKAVHRAGSPGDLTTGEQAVLVYVAEKKRVALSAVHKRFPGVPVSLTLSFLAQRGCLEFLYRSLPTPAEHGRKTSRLSPRQDAICRAIQEHPGFSAHLIQGVTGSGKTHLYIQLAHQVMAQGGQVLMLVPEIALSVQSVARLQQYLGRVEVIHSSTPPAKRRAIVRAAALGEVPMLVGPRSAVFVPFHNLKLIVVDEEHDRSYKQDTIPTYHGRDLAVYRGKTLDIPVVLGSATPCVESYVNATEKHKYRLHTMPERYGGAVLPKTIVVDLKQEPGKLLSNELIERLRAAFAANRRALVFLNKRGFYQAILCPRCGESIRCRRCSISMCFHAKLEKLICHQCGFTRFLPARCPACGYDKLRTFGVGTEQIEDILSELFPGVKIVRLDSDSVRIKDREAVINDFSQGKYQVMVGTQMITKGFDFHDVQVVGVIQADESLYIPDFRGAERAFQLISQVSGRSGRRLEPGCSVIQSFMPEHYAIRYALDHDFAGFAKAEAAMRKRLGYPPYKHLAKLSIRGRKRREVMQAIQEIKYLIQDLNIRGLTILGPVSAAIEKKKNIFRWHILLKGSVAAIHKAVTTAWPDLLKKQNFLFIDMDPYSF